MIEFINLTVFRQFYFHLGERKIWFINESKSLNTFKFGEFKGATNMLEYTEELN